MMMLQTPFYLFVFSKLCSTLIIREDNFPHRFKTSKRGFLFKANQLNFSTHLPSSYKVFQPFGIAPRSHREIIDNEVFDATDTNDDDDDAVVIEAANGTDPLLFDDPSFIFPSSSLIKKKERQMCITDQMEGICYMRDFCRNKGGVTGNPCNHEYGDQLTCCTFAYTCGGSSSERISYFQSPSHLSSKTHGSLTCDYDVVVQKNVCAVRVDYIRMNLARKLGGVCDIDQLYILNSIDGPTVGQCGPLSGYSTTVAVKPSQGKPLKIALLIQNEQTYFWNIKTTQLYCNELHNFKAPYTCGTTTKQSEPAHLAPSYLGYLPYSYQKPKENQKTQDTLMWWSFPEPVFNMYHYSATKKYILQEQNLASILKRKDMFTADRRIIGGTETVINEFPWQVAIALGDMFFCGGSLINELFVLTAAHCIMTRDTRREDLVIHLGDHDLTIVNETNHIVRGVRRVLFHSHFHPFLLDNDIALLQLDKPVIFTSTIQPICLPNPNESYATKKATVIGWGITSYPMGSPSSALQKIQVEVISNFHCSRMIEESIGAGMICAASPTLQGTCFGDSGGPLSVLTEHGQSVLIGLVSYGLTGCALIPSFPDIYTRVSEYTKWIDVNTIHR